MDKYRLSIHVPPYQVGYSVACFLCLDSSNGWWIIRAWRGTVGLLWILWKDAYALTLGTNFCIWHTSLNLTIICVNLWKLVVHALYILSFFTLCTQEARKSCLLVNAPLIHRATSRVPFSVLKYAMTLDGKHYGDIEILLTLRLNRANPPWTISHFD